MTVIDIEKLKSLERDTYNKGHFILNNYTENLSHLEYNQFDIVSIYRQCETWKRRTTHMTKKITISIAIRPEVLELLDRESEKESRSRSAMLELIILRGRTKTAPEYFAKQFAKEI